MGKRVFTEQQSAAIKTTDKTLLVSAAAGSGKTATLTERIIRQLTREENPLEVTSLLVVTFTNAAAAELRDRIGAAIRAAVAERGEDAHLIRQLHLLPSATIATIDSFCAEILRGGAERVGVSPSFRIADEAEARLLLESVLETLISATLSGEVDEIGAEEFAELCDLLTDSKSVSGIYETFEFIYEKLVSSEMCIDSLLPLVESYREQAELPPEEKSFGKYAMELMRELAAHYKKLLLSIKGRLFALTLEPKLDNLIACDVAALDSILSAATYEGMRDALANIKFITKPTVKTDMGDALEEYFMARNTLKAEIKALDGKLFTYSAEEWKALYIGLYKKLSTFHKFLSVFDRAFAEEKRRRQLMRYSDIERYAYLLLWQNGKRTELAEALAEKYEAVYIDEYQDVNSLQNKIFEAISRDNNRFMVGDIKQSIYGFRSAKPEIFASMKGSFPALDSCGDSPAASLFMSKNFRSDEGVVDFINAVFDTAFATFGESIGYEYNDRLLFGKVDKSPVHHIPEVTVFDKKEEIDLSDDDEEIFGRAEPVFVADKIEELIASGKKSDGTPIMPRDIAIVMRSVRGRSTVFAEALTERGIPVEIVESKNFFLNSAVLLALSLLNTIDNPRRDIYLAGLMRSPLFSFSADELLVIRKESPAVSLYDSLVKYTEENDYAHGRDFLSAISAYRDIAEGMSVHTLIARLYHETGLLSLASCDGGRENLILLYDYARRFEGSEFKGLHSFISYINTVIDRNARFEAAGKEENPDAVKIVTVHGSKGLEYPVVFYSDTGRKISNLDAKGRTVYAEDFGIATYLRSSDGLALVKNPVREIINLFVARKNFEEELRILYVALTRARERLYITGERSKGKDAYDAMIKLEREGLDTYSYNHLTSHLSIMLAAGLEGKAEVFDFDAVTEEPSNTENVKEQASLAEEEVTVGGMSREEIRDILTERFEFKYRGESLRTVPEKLSVSSLYPTVLDGADEFTATLNDGATDVEAEDEGRRILPRFIGGETPAERSALSGIATHLYLQFCNLEALAAGDAKAELERLTREAFISEEDAGRVRLGEIERFKKSGLFERMRNAKKLYRELRFNVRLPAESFTKSPERLAAVTDKKILVQGVIDCIIETQDGDFELIDYKTDRLTKEEREDRGLAEAKLIAAHKSQLSYYREAVLRMFGKYPKSTEVYSLHLGDSVIIQ